MEAFPTDRRHRRLCQEAKESQRLMPPSSATLQGKVDPTKPQVLIIEGGPQVSKPWAAAEGVIHLARPAP
jgi:hypothetical protein